MLQLMYMYNGQNNRCQQLGNFVHAILVGIVALQPSGFAQA